MVTPSQGLEFTFDPQATRLNSTGTWTLYELGKLVVNNRTISEIYACASKGSALYAVAMGKTTNRLRVSHSNLPCLDGLLMSPFFPSLSP